MEVLILHIDCSCLSWALNSDGQLRMQMHHGYICHYQFNHMEDPWCLLCVAGCDGCDIAVGCKET